MTKIKLTKDAHTSYKIGLDEIEGLKAAMLKVFEPIHNLIQDRAYWNEDLLSFAEYKSRDGFLAHSHNCGGIQLNLQVPKCESHDFSFLEFGECDDCDTPELIAAATTPGNSQCGYDGQECASECEGHLDAYLQIWFKFEGINSDGGLDFYLVASGGNQDAPYFRTKYLPTIFESSFSSKSVAGISRAASKHIQGLLNVLNGKE